MQLKPIKTEADHEAALREIERLWGAAEGSSDGDRLEILVARSGPGGNPRVYRVDGTEVALRRDLSRCIGVRPLQHAEAGV